MAVFVNPITEWYKTRVRTELQSRIPSPDDVAAKFIAYEYYRANGELLYSETVTDRERTKEEIWNTLQTIGADRVRWIHECGIIPLVLGEEGEE